MTLLFSMNLDFAWGENSAPAGSSNGLLLLLGVGG